MRPTCSARSTRSCASWPTAAGEAAAYPGLLAAIGESLSCAGALWLPGEDGTMRCVETWPAGAAAGARLIAEVWASGAPAAKPGVLAFPLPGIGVMGFSTAAPLEPDAGLLATMDSLGSQISQFVQRCRAQQAVRSSDARKSAILNAAFDCIVTMDHNGDVVVVNRAVERTFGYRPGEMIGRELAELIVPPSLHEAHRHGVEHYLQTGLSLMGGHPLELVGMRADGSEFPVEVIVTRADLPGLPLFLRLPRAGRGCAGSRTASRRSAAASPSTPRSGPAPRCEPRSRPEGNHAWVQQRPRRRAAWRREPAASGFPRRSRRTRPRR